MAAAPSTLSIGLPGATPAELLRELAPRIEQAGFHALWLNDTPDGDSLAGLAVAANLTSTLRLASGVIPVSRIPAEAIARRVEELDLPQDRLTVGIGSGNASPALDAVERGIDLLQAETSARIVVGALGPRMRRLGAERAGGVLFNWVPPLALAEAMAELRDQAAGRDSHGAVYVRAIVDPAARSTLASEAARYGSIPSYAANFERLGINPLDAAIGGTDGAAGLEASVRPYLDVADEVVLRAVTADNSLESYLRFVEAASSAA